MITRENILQIWEIARDTIGSEHAYDIAQTGREKAKASAGTASCFRKIRGMGNEAMELYITFLSILRHREKGNTEIA